MYLYKVYVCNIICILPFGMVWNKGKLNGNVNATAKQTESNGFIVENKQYICDTGNAT